jgi:hypothetical protein
MTVVDASISYGMIKAERDVIITVLTSLDLDLPKPDFLCRDIHHIGAIFNSAVFSFFVRT